MSHLIERAKAADERALGEALLERNADLPTTSASRKSLLSALVAAKAPALEALAAKAGWVDGQHVFVGHTGVTGDDQGKRKLCPPLTIDGARHRTHVTGTLEEWRKKVGPLFRWSSRFQLAAAAVLAAPLVRLVNFQPFAIVLFAESSVGKSSAMLLAGSILGLGKKEAMPNWNASQPGLHETACRFNDHALLIDETASSNLPKHKLYDLMRRVTYTYAEGADSLRHSKSGYAMSKQQSDAKGILVTTSEHSLDALAAFAGQVRDDGEIARAFNVPATTSGNDTIFDIWPKGIAPEGRKDWTDKKFGKLREACARQHGTAFEAYIKHLTAKDPAGLVVEIKDAMAEFDRALDLDPNNHAVQHAAKNFALVYAGGAQGIDAGLLRVKKERLLASITKCFNDGLACMGPPKDLEANAVKQLVAGLSSTEIPEKSNLGPDDDPVGFRRPVRRDDDRVMLAIKPGCFIGWFVDEAHAQAALRWLSAKGLLLLRDGASLPSGNITTESVVTFEKLTFGEGRRRQRRWIRFLDPGSG